MSMFTHSCSFISPQLKLGNARADKKVIQSLLKNETLIKKTPTRSATSIPGYFHPSWAPSIQVTAFSMLLHDLPKP